MKLKELAVVCALSLAIPSHAALTSDIADISTPQTIDFEDFDGFITMGTETLAPGLDFTGTPGSILGAFIADLGSNGIWGAGNHFAATDGHNTLEFTFVNGPSRAAGALLNSYNGSQMIISAFDGNHQLLESHVIDVHTPEDSLNEGTFFGIVRSGADIRSISFTGLGLVADNLTFATPVPEPGPYAMMLAGLGLMVSMVQVRRRGRSDR